MNKISDSGRLSQLMQRLRQFFIPDKLEILDPETELNIVLSQGRERILTSLLRFAALLGSFGFLGVIGYLTRKEQWGMILFYFTAVAIVVIVSIKRELHPVLRISLFLALLYLTGLVDLYVFGVAEDWRLYLMSLTIATTLFWGWRAGMLANLLSIVTFVIIATFIANGRIVITLSFIDSPVPNREYILTSSLVFLLVNGIFVFITAALLHEFEIAAQQERAAAQREAQRTLDLEHSLQREHQLASELQRAFERTEELSQLKSRIIKTVSHEFRTPLTAINNASELLVNYHDRLSPDKREAHRDRIRQSIFYLNDLLQDIALVDSSNSQSIQPQPQSITFGNLCRHLKADLCHDAGQPGNLHFYSSGDEAALLKLDYELLKQAVFNLLTNAIKYSSTLAPIEVTLTLNRQLIIAIADQGIGIPETELDKIWDLFYRGSNVEEKRGLGLGLYIVKTLVTAMGGSVSVQTSSSDPTGSTFFLTLMPIMLANEPTPFLPDSGKMSPKYGRIPAPAAPPKDK